LAKKPHDRNAYYVKEYCITLAEYNLRLAEQDGRCKCCGRLPKPGGRPLAVEHDHAIAAMHIECFKAKPGFTAWAPPFADSVCWAEKRSEARILVKTFLMRKSIRGLVCWFCNGGIERFFDSPEKLRAAAQYLDDFNNSLRIVRPICLTPTLGDVLAVSNLLL
jgi:recombination endonuclease VII